MVRFARADGSKGSNKRVLEEPTPWSEMVAQKKTKPENIEVEKKTKPENIEVEKKTTKNKKKKLFDKKKTTLINQNDDNTEKIPEEIESCSSDEKKPGENETQKEETTSPHKEKSLPRSKKEKKKIKLDVDNLKFVFENNQKYQVLDNGKKRPWFDLPYEESDRMTRHEGFWMKPEVAKQLVELKENLSATLDSDKVRKKMMKAKRKAHKELTRELINEQKSHFDTETGDVKKEENNEKNVEDKKNEEGTEVEGVLFDGFWIMKEGAVRLKKLRADLIQKGVSKEQQRLIMKSERRKEEKALRREKKRVCLRCRKRGHMVNECPEFVGEYGSQQNCICYTCGSTEHKISDCPQVSKDDFPHATCFVCRRVGHISRQCPDNPRGLYPDGGSCRGCGSVVHLAANCPLLKEEQEQATIRVGRIDGSAVESLDIEHSHTPVLTEPSTFKKKKSKVITFF